MTTTTSKDRTQAANLATDFLLTRFSVAFGRRRSYPASHPLVRASETQVYDALTTVLAERGKTTLIVGREELFIDEDTNPYSSSVARDLSERLRVRGVGSIAFDKGTTSESLLAAIGWLAADPDATDDTETAAEPPTLAGITIVRFAYGRLALGTEQWSDSSAGAAIWRVIASIALIDGEEGLEEGVLADDSIAVDESLEHNDRGHWRDTEGSGGNDGNGNFASTGSAPTEGPRDSGSPAEGTSGSGESTGATTSGDAQHGAAASGVTGNVQSADATIEASTDRNSIDETLGDSDPALVAEGMERRLSRDGYARRVAFVLLRVTDQIAQAPTQQRADLGERLKSVLGALRTSSVGTIIKSVGAGADQRRFMSQVIEALPIGALVEWLETAAQATGQVLSNPLLRLLTKLGARAQASGGSAEAERTFRDAARGLAKGWTEEGLTPSESVAVLDRMSRFETVRGTRLMPDAGATRVLQIALEVDQFGEDSQDAAQQLLDQGRLSDLMQWITDAPGRNAAAALRNYISSPIAIKATLLREPLDQVAARSLLTSLGEDSCDVLLEVLCDAEGRATRRLIYDRLREFGPALAPRLSQRLEGAPWYFVRNLLALMRDTAMVDGSTAEFAGAALFRYLNHEQEQVRVEALRLLLEDPAARGLAIRSALGDTSERVLRLALTNLGTGDGQTLSVVTPEVEARLLRLIDNAAHPEELLSRAVSALVDASPSMSVRDRLLAIATRRTLVLRRMVLADPQPLVIAALEVLAARYAKDSKVIEALKLAAAHTDSRVREAVKRTNQRTRAA